MVFNPQDPVYGDMQTRGLEAYHKFLKNMGLSDSEYHFRVFTCGGIEMLFERIKELELFMGDESERD